MTTTKNTTAKPTTTATRTTKAKPPKLFGQNVWTLAHMLADLNGFEWGPELERLWRMLLFDEGIEDIAEKKGQFTYAPHQLGSYLMDNTWGIFYSFQALSAVTLADKSHFSLGKLILDVPIGENADGVMQFYRREFVEGGSNDPSAIKKDRQTQEQLIDEYGNPLQSMCDADGQLGAISRAFMRCLFRALGFGKTFYNNPAKNKFGVIPPMSTKARYKHLVEIAKSEWFSEDAFKILLKEEMGLKFEDLDNDEVYNNVIQKIQERKAESDQG